MCKKICDNYDQYKTWHQNLAYLTDNSVHLNNLNLEL